MIFKLNNPDWTLSPYTGMNKAEWMEAGKFLLGGIFKHVKNENDPIVVPRQETQISYPQPDSPLWRVCSERFEGLARSFLIAAPIIKNQPDLLICGYSLSVYYKNQILLSITKDTPQYLLNYDEVVDNAKMSAIAKGREPDTTFQHTVECASLVIGLWMSKEVIWDTYTPEEKDKIAEYLSGFGHGQTVAHNWRLFNMLILGFLSMEGYAVDDGMIRDHASVILSYYAGDGWYRDGHSFDYYCGWAFHVYGPLWNLWYGYEKEPYIAAKIEEYSNLFVNTFHQFFDLNSHVVMWGRSSIYRSAASSPLVANHLLQNAKGNCGLARKIASGSLLQFITKEECFYEGIPTLGYYGMFPPMVHGYSCACSPFWMGNTFLCLYLPDNHPFWMEQENNGVWENENKSVLTSYLHGPGIAVSNDLYSGDTVYRTGKVWGENGNGGLKSYLRLGFHSRYPWEDMKNDGAQPMLYILTDKMKNKTLYPNMMFWCGETDGVLYRKLYFNLEYSFQACPTMDLADIMIPYGMLRVDRLRVHNAPASLALGTYALPIDDHEEISVEERIERNGVAKAEIITSKYGKIAMVTYNGFDDIYLKERIGVNPIAERSCFFYANAEREKLYEYKDYCLISCIMTKSDEEDFQTDELFPIHKISFSDKENCGGYGDIQIIMKNGEKKMVCFDGMEGKVQL